MYSVENIREQATDLKKQYDDLIQKGDLAEPTISLFRQRISLLDSILSLISLPEDSITKGLSHKTIDEFCQHIHNAIIAPDLYEVANATKHLED